MKKEMKNEDKKAEQEEEKNGMKKKKLLLSHMYLCASLQPYPPVTSPCVSTLSLSLVLPSPAVGLSIRLSVYLSVCFPQSNPTLLFLRPS